MPRFLSLLIALTFAVNFAPAETHIGGAVRGHLTVEGSPYIVDLNRQDYLIVNNDDTLIIDAGVTILFMPLGGVICYGVIRAEGTAEDSITFDMINAPWNTIQIIDTTMNFNREYYFSHCIFRNTSPLWIGGEEDDGAIMAPCNLRLEHCKFINNDNVAVYMAGRGLTIRECLFIEPYWAIRGIGNNTEINVERSVFIGDQLRRGGIWTYSYDETVSISNCLFLNCGVTSEGVIYRAL